MIPWHRLFGLALSDELEGSPWEVELEKDLSLQQQFLDVVILRRRAGKMTFRPPDGLDNLADHNLELGAAPIVNRDTANAAPSP